MNANAPRAFPEIGGIVHLDHVNFEVPDQDMATSFFCNGLGLARDPYQRADETNMGINVGMEQFHLPRRVAQTPRFNGVIGLVVPRIDVIAVRLELLKDTGRFDGTPYAFEAGGGEARIRTPYGFRLHLHEAGTVPSQRPLGISYVEIEVPPGASAGIGRFYGSVFHTPVDSQPVRGRPAVSLSVGPFQNWRFVETDLDDYSTHSMHVSFYMTNFSTVRAHLISLGATDGGRREDLYFFNRIIDPETGDEVFRLNNEVRSLYHPDFRRPLVNRWPMVSEPFCDQLDTERVVAEKLGTIPGTAL